jgi:hypothetical protein
MPENGDTSSYNNGGQAKPRGRSSGMARRWLAILASVVVALMLGVLTWYTSARSRSQAAASLSKIGDIKLGYSPAFFDDPNRTPVLPTAPDDIGFFLWRGIHSITWDPASDPDEAQVHDFWQTVHDLSGLQQIKAPFCPNCLAKNLKSASTLKSLELDGNLAPGDLGAISHCKELRTLHFSLEGGASKELKRLTALPELESFQCRGTLGDDACELFRETPHIRSVVFLGTPPGGKAFANAIANLSSLRRLRMPGCKDADDVCRALSACELEYLDLSDSDVTDEGIGFLHPETQDDSTFLLKNTGITAASLEHLCREGEVQVDAESCPNILQEDADRIQSAFPNARVTRAKR